jgi:hypothetical protein
LKELKQLTKLDLDLDYNNIGDEGAKEISTGLKELKQLTYLNLYLRENRISDEAE